MAKIMLILIFILLNAMECYSGNVINCDGIDDYIRFPAFGAAINAPFTFEVRVKWDTRTHGGTLIAVLREPTKYLNDYYFELNHMGAVNPDSIEVYVDGNGGGPIIDVLWTPILNKWYGFAVVRDKNIVTLYIDGKVIIGSVVRNNVIVSSWVAVGGGDYNGTAPYYFDGSFDYARIWNIARSSDQIKNYTNRNIQGKEDGLVLNVNFDEENMPIDKSGNGNHAVGMVGTIRKDEGLEMLR